MFSKTLTTADDRRNIVPLISPRMLTERSSPDLSARRTLQRRLNAFLFVRARRLTLLNSPLFIINAFPIITLVLVSIIFFGLLPCIGWIGIMVAVPTALRWYLRDAGPSRWARQLASSCIAEAICPSCAYPLDGIPEDDDACLTCPECNAAWLASRIVAPARNPDRPRLPELSSPLRCATRFIPIPARRLDPDDSGRIVPLVDAQLRDLPRKNLPTNDLFPEQRMRIVRSILEKHRVRRLLGALAIIACIGALWLTLIVAQTINPDAVSRSAPLVVIFGLLLTIAAVWAMLAIMFGALLIPRRAVIPAMLAEQRCPTCAVALTQPPDDTNLTTCPACAALWNIQPPGR